MIAFQPPFFVPTVEVLKECRGSSLYARVPLFGSLWHVWQRRPSGRVWEPAFLDDILRQLRIEMGLDQLLKREVDLAILGPASSRTRLRKVSFIDQVTNCLAVFYIRCAQ